VSWFNSPPQDVKARKRHLCTWCGQRILPGAIYKRWVCIGDDGPLTTKMHHECEQAMQRYASQAGREYEYDPYSFTRGCTCESGDRGHGHYPDCNTTIVPKWTEPIILTPVKP